MTTKATSTKNLKLQRGDGGGTEVFTTIGEVTNFKGPSETVAEIEVTSFDSTGKEYIAGLTDGGDVTFDLNFVASNAQQQGLRTDLRSGTVRNFKIILNDHLTTPTTVIFAAVVKAAPDLSGGVNAAIKASVALRVSGLPVWTYAP